MLLLAVGEGRTLSGAEELTLHQHVDTCEKCHAMAAESSGERFRWVARIPQDALDDPDLLVLPTVDPIVFVKGAELARGGMGRITRAHDRRLGRDVAIKEVLSPYLRARFEREAMITARLQHPAIVPVYEAGTWPDGSAFYTMRLVSGGTLADAISRTATLEDRLALLPHVLALTEALGYAHSRRIVHRDLKPGNVLVGEFGETVVIDWGLAKDLDRGDGEASTLDDGLASAQLTRAGSIIGTPCFLAPEQAAGAEIDERADVYALGAILYNVLAGHPPHWDRSEHSADQLIDAARERDPTPIAELVPRTPEDLRAILERAMARDPDARYPTAKEMAEELRRFEAGQLLGSRAYPVRELFVRWVRRHRAAVAVAAVAIAVLAIGGTISVQQILARQRATERALADSQLEKGRQLLIDGDPGQAAPYLAAAFAALPDDPVARRLTTIALRDATRRLGDFSGTAAAFRRDGGELAIGHADGSIAMIDPATGGVRRTLPPLGGRVAQLDYAPDGAVLAVAAATGAYLRDAGTGLLVATIAAVPSSEVRFLPGGDRVAITTATAVRMVGRDGRQLAVAEQLREPHGLALSGDDGALVVLTRDGGVLWPGADLTLARPVADDRSWRFTATIDHGDLITAGLDGVRRWDAQAHATMLLAEQVFQVCPIGDHTVIANGKIIDTGTGAVRSLPHGSIQVGAVIDPSHVVTGGYDRTLRIWDLERPSHPIVILDAATDTASLVVDRTGQRALSRGAGDDARFELWDVAHSAAPIRAAAVGSKIDAVLSNRHDRFAVHFHDGASEATRLFDDALQVVATIPGWPVGFRPNRDEIVTDLDGILQIYSVRDGRHLKDITDPERVWRVSFARGGTAIATSSENRVWLHDANWRVTGSFEVPRTISRFVLDDHDHVVTGHEDGAVRIWDARTGALLATAKGHNAFIADLEIRDDTLITRSWDLTMRLWAFPSGESRAILKRFDTHVEGLAIAPGGQLIATVDRSAAVSLWDTAQGRLLTRIPTSDQATCVVFIDDDHVVVGGDGGHLELIDLSVRPRAIEDMARLAASSRWQLVRGTATERR